jgi:uncharacterized protein (UPF0333 family)
VFSTSFGSTIGNDNQSVNSELEEIETSDIPVEHEQLYEKNVVKNVEKTGNLWRMILSHTCVRGKS